MAINLTSPISRDDIDTVKILRVDLDLVGKRIEIHYASGHVDAGKFVTDDARKMDVAGGDLLTLMNSNPTGASLFKRLMKALYGHVKTKEGVAGTVTDDSIG